MASEVLINIIVHINNTNTHHKTYTQPKNKQTTPKRSLILYNRPQNNAEYLSQLHKGFNSTEYNPTVDLEKEVTREQFI